MAFEVEKGEDGRLNELVEVAICEAQLEECSSLDSCVVNVDGVRGEVEFSGIWLEVSYDLEVELDGEAEEGWNTNTAGPCHAGKRHCRLVEVASFV
jgi:hypothetical protein